MSNWLNVAITILGTIIAVISIDTIRNILHEHIWLRRQKSLVFIAFLCLFIISLIALSKGMNGSDLVNSFHLSPTFTPQPPAAAKDLTVPDLEVVVRPDKSQQVKVGQNIPITAKLETKDGHFLLSDLVGSISQTTTSLQQLIGQHNTSCISAYLEADADQFNIQPSQPQDYPLAQQSITWSWIVTPKQANEHTIYLYFVIAGKTSCGGKSIIGPYRLINTASYTFEVSNPNNNAFTQMLQGFDLGTAITSALGTLLVMLITWICARIWQQTRGKSKTETINSSSMTTDTTTINTLLSTSQANTPRPLHMSQDQWMERGNKLLGLNNYEEALIAFEQVIILEPTCALAFNYKGFCLYELHHYAEALVAFEQSIRLDPNCDPARFNKDKVIERLMNSGNTKRIMK